MVDIGRVAVRASGSFNIQTSAGVVQGINAKHCTILARADGYDYSTLRADPQFLPRLKSQVSLEQRL